MESNPNPKLLLFFVRHGERLDQVDPGHLTEKEKLLKYNKCDPPLTENGKQLAFQTAKLTEEFLNTYRDGAFKDCPQKDETFKMISSRFLRTLQTAAYFKNGLIGEDTKKDLYLNNNIVVELGTYGGDPSTVFQKGKLAQEGEERVLKNWMDCKPDTMRLVQDENAVKQFKTDGSYRDTNLTERYITGFQDIVQKHFVEREDNPPHQVITCISHSCGIDPFIEAFRGKGKGVENPCYCCTIAVEIELLEDK